MIKYKLEKFEGPLSLLIKLIEKEEMDVTQVNLASVADQFIAYVRKSGDIKPEEVADFLVVAARLLLIKSKALLPYLYPEEEQEIEEFEKQLKMYKEFIAAAKRIEKKIGKKKFMFAREFNRKVSLNLEKSFSPPKKLQMEDLNDCYKIILSRMQPPEKLEESTLENKINIDDKIYTIQQIIAQRIKVSFNAILDNAKNKTEIIVSFLAALELMRQREVVLTQEAMFGEIFIKRRIE